MIPSGLKNTLMLAVASTLLGIAIGLVLAVMGISRSAWIRTPARVYTDIFRGLPAIVTILLIGQGFARIGRQLFGPSPYPLGILALSLIAGAYIGEIFRSGIQSVERGQLEACRALGMTYPKGMRLIVIPQGRAARAAGAGEPVHRQHQGFEPRLLPRPARLRARAVPGRAGPGGSVGQPVAADAGGLLLPADHGAAHPSGELRSTAPARGTPRDRADERPRRKWPRPSRPPRPQPIRPAQKGARPGGGRPRHGLWRFPSAAQGQPVGAGRLHHLRDRTFGLGQVDAAALPQQARRTPRRGCPARRSQRAGRESQTGCAAGSAWCSSTSTSSPTTRRSATSRSRCAR